jgi:Zn-dependent M28 family amino/carboxypeptidase
MKKIWAELMGKIFSSSRIEENIRRLLVEIGPRSAGTEGGRAAQELVRRVLIASGMDEIRVEPMAVQAWERGPLRFEMTQPRQRMLHALSLGMSTGTPGLSAPVKDLGYGLPDEIRRCREAAGNWVLVEDRAPEGVRAPHRAVKMSAAQEIGAAGFILFGEEEGDLPKTGTCRFAGYSRIPGIGLSREQGLALRRMLDGGEEVHCRLVMANRCFTADAANIIGVLRGRESPEEEVCVGGHLDAWDVADGALDNGSGVLVTLEAARALANLPERPRRSLAFCCFMAEETGLVGSTHHVRNVGDEVVAYLNLDIVSEPLQLNAGGKEAVFPLLEKVTQSLAPLGVEKTVTHRLGLHSDHLPFLLKGIPTLSWTCRFRDGVTRFCHSAADTTDKLDRKGLHLNACATAILLHALAEEPERPVRILDPETTRTMLERAGLKQDLVEEGSWPF